MVRITHIVALVAFYHGDTQFVSEVNVFTEGFPESRPTGITSDIEYR